VRACIQVTDLAEVYQADMQPSGPGQGTCPSVPILSGIIDGFSSNLPTLSTIFSDSSINPVVRSNSRFALTAVLPD